MEIDATWFWLLIKLSAKKTILPLEFFTMPIDKNGNSYGGSRDSDSGFYEEISSIGLPMRYSPRCSPSGSSSGEWIKAFLSVSSNDCIGFHFCWYLGSENEDFHHCYFGQYIENSEEDFWHVNFLKNILYYQWFCIILEFFTCSDFWKMFFNFWKNIILFWLLTIILHYFEKHVLEFFNSFRKYSLLSQFIVVDHNFALFWEHLRKLL